MATLSRTPLQERIKTLAKTKGTSINELERKLGLSHGLMMKRNNPSADNITEILMMYPDVSAEWLMRGEGEIIKSVATYNEVIKMGNNNQHNFSQSLGCGPDVSQQTIDALLSMLREKDDRIKELTDKIISML